MYYCFYFHNSLIRCIFFPLLSAEKMYNYRLAAVGFVFECNRHRVTSSTGKDPCNVLPISVILPLHFIIYLFIFLFHVVSSLSARTDIKYCTRKSRE